jgi:transposase-like protein
MFCSARARPLPRPASSWGVTDQTYFRWRKLYGGLKVDQAKRPRELEAENARLKRAAAELTIDKRILKEVAEGKY